MFGACPHNKETCKQIFEEWDHNHDGVVSRQEFETMLKRLDDSFTQDELDFIFKEADRSNHGVLNIDEFLSWAYTTEDQDIDLTTPQNKTCEFAQGGEAGSFGVGEAGGGWAGAGGGGGVGDGGVGGLGGGGVGGAGRHRLQEEG